MTFPSRRSTWVVGSGEGTGEALRCGGVRGEAMVGRCDLGFEFGLN